MNDTWIRKQAKRGMIYPFEEKQVKEIEIHGHKEKAISYGVSSYGYDLRLSPNDFRIFAPNPGSTIDPKHFDGSCLTKQMLYKDDTGGYFVLPPRTYGLGVALERVELPRNITATAWNKSTYARCGLTSEITPVEAGWAGHLTLEFMNHTDAEIKLYANEGIIQLVFSDGEPCEVSYRDREGKYQNQKESVTTAL